MDTVHTVQCHSQSQPGYCYTPTICGPVPVFQYHLNTLYPYTNTICADYETVSTLPLCNFFATVLICYSLYQYTVVLQVLFWSSSDLLFPFLIYTSIQSLSRDVCLCICVSVCLRLLVSVLLSATKKSSYTVSVL